MFACTEAGVRCHISILDKDLGTYVTTDSSKHWYACQPCGENKLSKMVKDMFGKIEIEGKMNHSL